METEVMSPETAGAIGGAIVLVIRQVIAGIALRISDSSTGWAMIVRVICRGLSGELPNKP